MKYLSIILIAFVIACQPSEDQQGAEPKEEASTQELNWQEVDTQNEPTARHENAFVEADGKFYLIGGRGERPVDIYDPATQSWSEGQAPSLEMHHFQAVAHEGKIYVMGALTGGFPDEQPIPDIYIYDPKADSWSQGPTIPEGRRRGAAGALVHDGKFYLVAGIQNGHTDGYVNWLDSYDPSTNTWSKLPDAPHQRDHVQAAVIDNKIIVAGGRTTSAATGQTMELTVPEVDVYDIEKGTWSTLENNIPTQRAGTTSVVYDDKLLVIGGESGAMEAAHHQVEALNPITGEWTTLPSLQQGRHGTQAFVFDNQIYIAAGSGNRGGGPELSSLEAYP